jgi:polyhydroxyalkanoate synthesis regulator phasin
MPETNEAEASKETSSQEAVASPRDTRPTPQETGAEVKGKETQGQENRVPQSRFNEVIAEREAYKGEVEALNEKIAELSERTGKLVNLLDAQKDDVNLVANLRNLAVTTEDTSIKDAIELLDAELTGTRKAIEETAEEKVAEGTLTQEQAERFVRDRTDKLEDRIAEERAQRLFDQANLKAERMLNGLPEQYNDEDRKYIAEAWLRRVDWDGMEEDPDAMDNFLVDSLQDALDFYGTPRGSLRSAEVEVDAETGEPASREPTPEEIIADLRNIDWSEMKDGKPKYSDDVFSAGMAEVLRQGRKSA